MGVRIAKQNPVRAINTRIDAVAPVTRALRDHVERVAGDAVAGLVAANPTRQIRSRKQMPFLTHP